MDNWRLVALISILCLSILDLSLTYYYVRQYRSWQSEKPYNLIETNPLLVFLWNKLGLVIGMIIGSLIILTLLFILGKDAHWVVVILVLAILVWAIYNHYNNITLLHKLIAQYPDGYLDPKIFGEVVGNNLR